MALASKRTKAAAKSKGTPGGSSRAARGSTASTPKPVQPQQTSKQKGIQAFFSSTRSSLPTPASAPTTVEDCDSSLQGEHYDFAGNASSNVTKASVARGTASASTMQPPAAHRSCPSTPPQNSQACNHRAVSQSPQRRRGLKANPAKKGIQAFFSPSRSSSSTAVAARTPVGECDSPTRTERFDVTDTALSNVTSISSARDTACGSTMQSPTTKRLRATSSVPAGRFSKMSCGVWTQYHSIYLARLQQLRGAIFEQARGLWGARVQPQAFLPRITWYRRFGNAEVVIVGIILKEMRARPNLAALCRNAKGMFTLTEESVDEQARSLCSDGDTVAIEDPGMRLDLILPPEQVALLVTGLAVGLRGIATPEGTFKVHALCFPKAVPAPLPISVGPAKFVAFVSGLAFGSDLEDLAEARDRVVKFFSLQPAGLVLRVLVCGGTFVSPRSPASALDLADSWFARLAAAVPVEILPGRTDPTNISLPQMEFHPHFFKTARALPADRFRSVSNPYTCTLAEARLLGHSGQPVDDLMRCSSITDPIQALSLTLESRHLAPTAPDTLDTQPFVDADPFVMEASPHVLFSGGHSSERHLWSPQGDGGTMCVCVPAFEKCRRVVFVNLRNPCDVKFEDFGPVALAAKEPLGASLPMNVTADSAPVVVNLE